MAEGPVEGVTDAGHPAGAPVIAVIGAGNLGRKIAWAAALAGYPVVLEDILPSALRKAQEGLQDSLQDSIKAGRCSPVDAETASRSLIFTEHIEEAVRQADLVIEAVPDELESKLEIFTLLDKICRPGTILVTTSMAFTPDDITDVTYRRDRCAGMRFSPMDSFQKLKIVGGTETSEHTMSLVTAVARDMGQKSALKVIPHQEMSRLAGATEL